MITHKVEVIIENEETTKEVVIRNKWEKNEWIFDSSYNSWYYLNEDGSYARNQWIQSNGKWYYVLSNGKMAKNTVIDGYQLNENGEWV